MSRCQLQSGLLTPVPCPNAAIGDCVRCGRGVCEAHAGVADAGLLCRTCQLQVEPGVDPLTALAAGTALAALFTASDVAAFADAAVEEEADDMTADLS